MNSETMTGRRREVRIAVSVMLSVALAFSLSGMARAQTADTQSAHHREYRAALQVVLEGPERLVDAMRRIRLGEVAHYDFLQYEHIELIRHARALAHPPAGLVGAERARIVALAGDLLEAVNDLEWLIADFLRAHVREEIHAINPDRVSAAIDPDSMLESLERSPLTEAAMALQRQYHSATGA